MIQSIDTVDNFKDSNTEKLHPQMHSSPLAKNPNSDSKIFDAEPYLNPKYDKYERYVKIMYRGMWTPAKYEKDIAKKDVPHLKNVMSYTDQQCVIRCLMAVALVEDKVKMFWSTLPLDIPQTIISDVCGLFAQSEVTHRRSYHPLLEKLGIDVTDARTHPELADRIAYLSKYLETEPEIIGKKRFLKKLVLFTTLVERASLFTQFYILMSYDYHKVGLTTISALQQSTATEEVVHYSFGADLVNDIKEEYPQLWSDYLVELIEKNIQAAYDAELKLIDWFFEAGVPGHLTKEEVINFLNYNFNVISTDLGLNLDFKYDKLLYENKNSWMIAKIKMAEPDFFNAPPGGYAAEEEEIDLDEDFDI